MNTTTVSQTTMKSAKMKPSAFSLKEFISSFMLVELFKGMVLTGKFMFRPKVTVQFPEEKTPLSPRFRGLHALRRYEKRGRAVHCLQIVRSGVPSHGHNHRINDQRRRQSSDESLRHRFDQMYFLWLL